MTAKRKDRFGPFSIGALPLKNNLIAAPMAGLSSLPYRVLAIEQGCALAISEMVSAEGIIRAHKRTRRYFTNDPAARPFGVQIFGADPQAVFDAIQAIEAEPVDLIDINMGCPVKKVCSKGAGAALMRTPERARGVMKAARSATKRALTVKMRSGWDEASINCVEIARIAEDEGVDALTIHPRTKQQLFKGKSDWKWIAKVKDAVGIPVVGSGDVLSREDAVRMMDETGCDGVMIGRAAVGNPWIFRQIAMGSPEVPSASERGRMASRHLDHLSEFMGERLALLNMRAILPWYGKGLKGVRKFLQAVHVTKSPEELKALMSDFFEGPHRAAYEEAQV